MFTVNGEMWDCVNQGNESRIQNIYNRHVILFWEESSLIRRISCPAGHATKDVRSKVLELVIVVKFAASKSLTNT